MKGLSYIMTFTVSQYYSSLRSHKKFHGDLECLEMYHTVFKPKH